MSLFSEIRKNKGMIGIVDGMINEVESVIILKDDKGYKKLLSKLTGVLVNTFDDQAAAALKEAIDYLTGLGENGFTNKAKKEVQRILQEKLGTTLSTLVEESVLNLTEDIYKLGIKEVGASVKIKLDFGVKDIESSGILGNQNLFWVGDYYDEKLAKEFDEILDGYFNADKSIKEVADDFEVKFQDRIDAGRSYYEGLAEHTTNTIRGYGQIRGFKKAGLKYYEFLFVNDDRQSDICQYLSEKLSGKKFSVVDANDFIDKKILKMEDPREVKDLAPFHSLDEIKEFDIENLPEGFGVNLFHYRCRTKKVAHFT